MKKNDKNASASLEEMKSEGQLRQVFHRLRKNKSAMVGMCIFAFVVLVAILAPVISPYGYADMDMSNTFCKPCLAHPFGTDNFGRDMLSRVIWGARYSVSLGVCSVLLGLVAGVVLGLLAGYYGGWIDFIIMRFCDIWQSIPGMLMTIVVCSVLGTGWLNTVLALSIGQIPGGVRMIRAQLLSLREQEFIEAEHAINCPAWKLMFKHMLPNAISPMIVSTTMAVGGMIMASASLSYLGVGVQPPTPEWGALITAGREYMRNSGYLMLFPGLAIAITIFSLNLFGDGLRDAMDPKLKN